MAVLEYTQGDVGGDYRMVCDCDASRESCERERRAAGRWLWGLAVGAALSLGASVLAFAGAHVATDSRQDAELRNLDKAHTRILDKLDRIENLIRTGRVEK